MYSLLIRCCQMWINAWLQAALARRASVRAAREDEERRARLEEQEARVRLAAAHPQTHDWAEKGHVQFVDQVLPDVD